MRVCTIILGFLSLQVPAFPQSVTIAVHNAPACKGTFLALSGERSTLVDSVRAEDGSTFKFEFERHRNAGLYRLTLANHRGVDFVLDGEDVAITVDSLATPDSFKVVRSESNRLYYSFRKLNHQYKSKSEILQLVLARYPSDEGYYAATREVACDLQKSYLEFVRSAAGTRPSSFAARYIASAQLPVVDLTEPRERQLAYLKTHALDSIDFTDEGLIHSDLFTSKSIEYLTYYRNPQFPKDLLAKEFNRATDSLLNRAKVNRVVYKHITEYLLDGFKQFGFEECINYIVDNYVIKDDLCLEESGNTIQRLVDQKKQIRVGVLAPEITLPDTADELVSLRQLSAEKMLVVFYTTTCPHCQSMMRQLQVFARERGTSLSVLAVSLDTNPNEWLNCVRANRFSWTNVIDMQGWGGKSATDYFIYATPTMVLLDRDKRIIGKPMTVAELKKLL